VLVGSHYLDPSEVWLVRPGRHDKLVTLHRSPQVTDDNDGFWEALTPASWWISVEPLDPSVSGDGSRIQSHRVRGRYRADVTVDTRITYGTRELFVKGVQNIGEQNVEIVLYCEEAIP
jgi:head-tail adaptor